VCDLEREWHTKIVSDLPNYLQLNMMAMDYLVREDDQMVVCGQVNIIDLKDVTLTHASQLTPSLVKKVMTCTQVHTICNLKSQTKSQNLIFCSAGWVFNT
jgi:hypothetical protein